MTDAGTVQQIAALLQGKVVGNPGDVMVEGVSTLQDAGPGDICYFGNSRYAKYLTETAALAVITEEECETTAACQIIVEAAYESFRKVLEVFKPDRSSGFSGIHASAVIHPSARIAEGVSIDPGVVIHRDCKVDAGSFIGTGSVLGAGTQIGDNCLIHPNVSLLAGTVVGSRTIIPSGTVAGSDGFGFVPDPAGRHRKIPQNGNVVIGNDVEIGSNCSIDRAVTGSTVIGDFTKLDNLIQVAHNVKIGKSCFIAAQTGIAGSTIIGNGVVIGGQVGIAGHIVIEDGVVVAAKSGVTKSVSAGLTVSGNPCRPHNENLRISAAAARLPGILAALRDTASGNEEETED